MDNDQNNCNNECQCDGPGYCPVYGIKMTPRLHNKCKQSQIWRENFQTFFNPPQDDISRQARHETAMRSKEMQEEQKNLDEAIAQVEASGITLQNYQEQSKGAGDIIGKVFSKLGITEDTIAKWAGIGGCGCSERKQFLNKILPLRKRE